ncbi:hypothetical protein FIBSPDRAFT_949328 [Athelia psychrophila]|uniref:Uncharacterized protein n=1 Tax=Athelia psychrophila TaxID=1759441 RepID=A0A166PU19_9AGAM|nr:hypothetical protein FIBSPDRAFT_949328 [Fibularhizoctonia sp. CBS 109695]
MSYFPVSSAPSTWVRAPAIQEAPPPQQQQQQQQQRQQQYNRPASQPHPEDGSVFLNAPAGSTELFLRQQRLHEISNQQRPRTTYPPWTQHQPGSTRVEAHMKRTLLIQQPQAP